jgi:hypothetical protein
MGKASSRACPCGCKLSLRTLGVNNFLRTRLDLFLKGFREGLTVHTLVERLAWAFGNGPREVQTIATNCLRAHLGAVDVVVRLAVVTLPPCSTTPAVAGCRLVDCSVVSGRPLRSRAVAKVSQRVRVGLGPVLASRAPSSPAAAATAWRGRGRVPIAGWSLGGVGPDRGLRGGGGRGW